jgi:hypothetical protein
VLNSPIDYWKAVHCGKYAEPPIDSWKFVYCGENFLLTTAATSSRSLKWSPERLSVGTVCCHDYSHMIIPEAEWNHRQSGKRRPLHRRYTDAETLARTNREITVFLKVRQHSSTIITGWVTEGIDASMQNEVGNSVMECRQLRLSVVAL